MATHILLQETLVPIHRCQRLSTLTPLINSDQTALGVPLTIEPHVPYLGIRLENFRAHPSSGNAEVRSRTTGPQHRQPLPCDRVSHERHLDGDIRRRQRTLLMDLGERPGFPIALQDGQRIDELILGNHVGIIVLRWRGRALLQGLEP